ncbi:MAG: hypothetical protein WA902_15225 [Thermosynechococcaceae cyanobacterium]
MPDQSRPILSASDLPQLTYNEYQVPKAFLLNCGTWEGTAQRINLTGEKIDEHLVQVKIEIDGTQYVQTNTVRMGTPREVTATYFGDFVEGVLVFPLTDEVYTLGGEKATEFSGIAWAVTDDCILYRGSRRLQGTKTYYNEIITLINETHRVRTTQFFEDNVYKLVTMIDEVMV